MLSQRLQAILALGALFLLLTVCDAVSPSSDTSDDFQVSLENAGFREAQILGPGEQPDPSLILAVGKSREITLEEAEKGDAFGFRALIFEEAVGGAWLEVANKSCVYDAEFRARIVSYRGGTTIVCENWSAASP